MRRIKLPPVGVYVVFTRLSDSLPRNLVKNFILRKHKSCAGEGASRHAVARKLTLHGSHFGFIRTLSIRTTEITLCLRGRKCLLLQLIDPWQPQLNLPSGELVPEREPLDLPFPALY